MKILTLHCDYIRFKALKKAVKDAEELTDPTSRAETEVPECLVVLTAIEKGDTQETINKLLESISKTAKDVNSSNIVLYPYAHLSSNLANPKVAQEMLQNAESALKKDKSYKTVSRAPFGYYKTFELKVKGHPLSELSKEFKSELGSKTEEVVEEDFDYKKLLREISKTKLDSSRLKDNDHRILGQKLDLFSFNEVSPGMPFWHESGWHIYKKLEQFIRELLIKFEYKEVQTPQILDSKLFKISGHWKHYKDNMFLTNYEDRQLGVKPMNCPGSMLIYKTRPRSYKELPLRLAEFGEVHRVELSGVLAGLFRVIRFTQDDAHIFCTKEQIGSEIKNLLELIKIIYEDTFGFEYSFELSTRPEKFMGDKKDWDYAEKTLEEVLKKSKVKFKINKGDGAFYGPKIDIHIKDSLGRSWQCATIQLDMQMPQRFEIKYIDNIGKEESPFVIHRAILGSMERFIGVLLEHLNGNLPLWLSPRQVRIISFTDRNTKAAQEIAQKLRGEMPDIKLEEDYRSDTVQAKIRDAELLKTNYVIVVGDKEEENNTLSVRPRGGKPKFGIKVEEFITEIKEKISSRRE